MRQVLQRCRIKGAVHITGDAYLKFTRLTEFSKGVGFEFSNFKPQHVFDIIQKTAETYGGITDEEMLKTFNLGWGFALVVDKVDEDDVLDVLQKSNVSAETIGKVIPLKAVRAIYKGKKIVLQ